MVIGGGTMGAGIVEVLVDAGVVVHLVEPDDKRRDRVAKLAAGRAFSASGALVPSPDADLVVEAIPEHLEGKQAVVAEIECFVGPSCVVASNTSSLSIDRVGASMVDPERLIGLHFFNPVPKSLVVELVVGTASAPWAVERGRELVGRIGKELIEVRDSPGFATSRLGLALGLEAIRMVEAGVASVEDIDRGMKLGYRHPMGPLRLTDLVGLDVRLAIAEQLHDALGPRFEPPDLLRQMVAAGRLGKKTGRGFYSWW
jgi:3-hydroxybutyryl-CoA dehydrogenase